MDNQRILYAGSMNTQINYDTNYLENLLKINKGKKIKIFTSFNKEFEGILEKSGQNYIILSDYNDGKWYILLNDSINFIYSQEQINYWLLTINLL